MLAKVDHRISHVKNKGKEMSFMDIKWVNPFPSLKSHTSVNFDAIELLKKYQKDKLEIDLCYIDPPYGGKQSDYGYIYSFFEECLYEEKYAAIVERRPGLKRFIGAKNYKKNFTELIELTSFIPTLIISYSDSSWGDIDKICDIIKKYRKCDVEEYKYAYQYRNRKNNNSREYLIISRK